MTADDLKTLIDLGGYAIAIGVLLVVLTMLVRGDLVPGSVAKAQAQELEALRKLVRDDILPAVREMGKGVTLVATWVQAQMAPRREGRARERRDET